MRQGMRGPHWQPPTKQGPKSGAAQGGGIREATWRRRGHPHRKAQQREQVTERLNAPKEQQRRAGSGQGVQAATSEQHRGDGLRRRPPRARRRRGTPRPAPLRMHHRHAPRRRTVHQRGQHLVPGPAALVLRRMRPTGWQILQLPLRRLRGAGRLQKANVAGRPRAECGSPCTGTKCTAVRGAARPPRHWGSEAAAPAQELGPAGDRGRHTRRARPGSIPKCDFKQRLKQLRINVWRHTLELVRTSGAPELGADELTREPKTLCIVHPGAKRAHGLIRVSVADEDGLDRARWLTAKGLKVAVLNMASASSPGGGVRAGAGAQRPALWE